MIERLQRIATFLERLRFLIILLGLVSFLFAVFSLMENPWLDDDELLIPSIVGFCWALTLYAISRLFVYVPVKPDTDAGLRIRLSVSVRRGLLWILGVFVVGLTIAVGVLSFELLRTWF